MRLNESTRTATSASVQSSCAAVIRSKRSLKSVDRPDHDLEQAVLLRLEVVVEGGRADPDRLGDVGPLRVLVPRLAEVLGGDLDDLLPLHAGLEPRRSLSCSVSCARHATPLSGSSCDPIVPVGLSRVHSSSSRPAAARDASVARRATAGCSRLRGRAVRRVVEPAAVDALDDDRDLPVRERDPEAERGRIAPRGSDVRARELLRAREAGQRGDGLGEQGVRSRCAAAAISRPVGDHQPDVGQRVADRAELPVEDGPHVPVSCRRARCRGGSRRGRATARARPAAVPRTALRARRSVAARGSSTRATGGVQRRSCRSARDSGRRSAARPMASTSSACNAASVLAISSPTARARVRVERLGDRDGREDEPVDVLHHVERGAADLVVRAEGERPRNAGARLRQRAQHHVLARHVVRGGEDLAQRRPAEHDGRPRRVGEPVRQVRLAFADAREAERRRRDRGDASRSQAVSRATSIPGTDGSRPHAGAHRIVHPPSTAITWPVQYDDASDARKRSTPSSSSLAAQAAHRALRARASAASARPRTSSSFISVGNQPGAIALTRIAVSGPLVRELAGEAVDGGLGGDVPGVRHRRRRDLAEHRADVDHRPGALPAHRLGDELAEGEDRLEVDAEDVLEASAARTGARALPTRCPHC